jgi:hypothetical protein
MDYPGMFEFPGYGNVAVKNVAVLEKAACKAAVTYT